MAGPVSRLCDGARDGLVSALHQTAQAFLS